MLSVFFPYPYTGDECFRLLNRRFCVPSMLQTSFAPAAGVDSLNIELVFLSISEGSHFRCKIKTCHPENAVTKDRNYDWIITFNSPKLAILRRSASEWHFLFGIFSYICDSSPFGFRMTDCLFSCYAAKLRFARTSGHRSLHSPVRMSETV